MNPIRLVTTLFDRTYINSSEREILRNVRTLRAFFKVLIAERRKELIESKEEAEKRGDFLTLLIQDELFQDNEERMIDECFLFLVAST